MTGTGADDGTRTVGTVTVTRTASGWTARCSRCPFTDSAGEFGRVAITNRATTHHCGKEN